MAARSKSFKEEHPLGEVLACSRCLHSQRPPAGISAPVCMCCVSQVIVEKAEKSDIPDIDKKK